MVRALLAADGAGGCPLQGRELCGLQSGEGGAAWPQMPPSAQTVGTVQLGVLSAPLPTVLTAAPPHTVRGLRGLREAGATARQWESSDT